MTTTMKTFLIVNRITAQSGLFLATSEDDAVAAMIRDAGYRDAQHEAEVLDASVEKLRDELRVTEVDVPAAIEADRESVDCDDDVLVDADAVARTHAALAACAASRAALAAADAACTTSHAAYTAACVAAYDADAACVASHAAYTAAADAYAASRAAYDAAAYDAARTYADLAAADAAAARTYADLAAA